MTDAYTIFHVSNVNPRFAYYYYLSLDNAKAMRPLYSGLKKTINVGTFLGTKLPVSPRPEQDQIVRFLDWKVAIVNKLIALKRKQITLLEEHKASVLNAAVTRGIQLNRSLKYSGLKWFPKVPEHWEIVTAKALFSK